MSVLESWIVASRLTVVAAAAEPGLLATAVDVPDGRLLLYRPLMPGDVDSLADFLASLSPETRRYWELESYDAAMAREFCAAIGRYDKLRMVALLDLVMVGLFEFSMDLTDGDLSRYSDYGLPLQAASTCRFGACLRDAEQGRGIASALMPHTIGIARRFGKQRVILWGGVMADNAGAQRFYTRSGFRAAGAFLDDKGQACIDMYLDVPATGIEPAQP